MMGEGSSGSMELSEHRNSCRCYYYASTTDSNRDKIEHDEYNMIGKRACLVYYFKLKRGSEFLDDDALGSLPFRSVRRPRLTRYPVKRGRSLQDFYGVESYDALLALSINRWFYFFFNATSAVRRHLEYGTLPISARKYIYYLNGCISVGAVLKMYKTKIKTLARTRIREKKSYGMSKTFPTYTTGDRI